MGVLILWSASRSWFKRICGVERWSGRGVELFSFVFGIGELGGKGWGLSSFLFSPRCKRNVGKR